MRKKYVFIFIIVIAFVLILTRKKPEYYKDIVVINDQEYRLEPHDFDEDNPSVTTIYLDIPDELEIKVLDGGCYSVWITENKGLEFISEEKETIDKNPFRQIKMGGTNYLAVYKYKVLNKSMVSLRMKNITIVEDEKNKSYDDSQYFREIIFDFK